MARTAEVGWKRYALGLLLLNLLGIIVVYLLQRLQAVLPLNPQDLAATVMAVLVALIRDFARHW